MEEERSECSEYSVGLDVSEPNLPPLWSELRGKPLFAYLRLDKSFTGDFIPKLYTGQIKPSHELMGAIAPRDIIRQC